MSIEAQSEDARLAALARYDVLDTPSEESFDRITRVVKNALDVPIAGVTLLDGHRQWLKSSQGVAIRETARNAAFCNVAIRLTEPLVIEDAAVDPRFRENVYVIGAPYIRAYAGMQLRTPDGHNMGALCAIDTRARRFEPKHIAILEDLADMVMNEMEAQKLATTDSLTGVLSRRGFRAEGERALELAKRHQHPLSCIAFDLDHFKAVNDQHGHAAGDRVLIATVETCRERLRSTDLLGRLGGEEFAVLLPHTDAAGAVKVAEAARSALEARSKSASPTDPRVTASFGIAQVDTNAATLDELLRRADIALYSAKSTSRNTCVLWKDTEKLAAATHMRRVLKAGQIVFNSGRSVVDCTVRALGETAASLHVISTAGIPDTFKLAIAADGTSRKCVVSIKQNQSLEVLFQ